MRGWPLRGEAYGRASKAPSAVDLPAGVGGLSQDERPCGQGERTVDQRTRGRVTQGGRCG
eukprot:118097-Prorocentrum_minimum.AAC.2